MGQESRIPGVEDSNGNVVVRRLLGTGALVLVVLALLRLADAYGKTELGRQRELSAIEEEQVQASYDSLAGARRGLALEEQFLKRWLAFYSGDEPYLVLDRAERRLELAVGDKTLLVARYRLGGPVREQQVLGRLPVGTLEVLARNATSDWYRPDWLYEQRGIVPPRDSSARIVRNAFGPGEIFLGGDIVIHGRVREAVAPEAVDRGYIELDDGPLRSLVSAVKKGTTVLIH
jgi:hypothetical protein